MSCTGSGWILPLKAKYGVVVWNYRPDIENHLPLSVGDTVHIVEEYEGIWYRGYLISNKEQKGVFPASYVYLKEAVVERRGKTENITSTDLPIVQEVTPVLREWGELWTKLFQTGERPRVFQQIRSMIRDLMEMRRKVISGSLTADLLKGISHQVADLVDYGNNLLNLDLSIRDDKTCQAADIRNLSAVEVFKLHEKASEKVRRRRIEEEKNQNLDELHAETMQDLRKSHVYSLYVTVKNFVCRIGEDADVFMSLYDGKRSEYISENYYVRWGSQGLPKNIEMLNNLKAIFTDLGSKDLQREKIFLVCRIIRIGRMELKEAENKKMTTGLRRAFGAAVMDITGIIKGTVQSDEDQQVFIPFQQVSGDNESLQQVINRAITSREVNHKGQGLWVSFKVLNGDLRTIRHDFQHLVTSTTAVVRKMGFPEIIMPGDVRNDLYITIISGEFERGTKTSQKNAEATMCVSENNGKSIPLVVSMGSGEDPENIYRSHIYYQNKSPKWMEVVKVQIPIEDFYNAHLRFTFRHRSTFESKDKTERDFGLAFVKLMKDDGTTLADGVHNLVVYKIESRKLDAGDSKKYLRLPSSKEEIEITSPAKSRVFPRAEGFTMSKDIFTISTLVVSTKLTQNVALLGLLKWKTHPQNLENILVSLMKVDGEDIVKFLQDTLDALFDIMMENPDDGKYDSMVFEALIFIITLIAEKKFFHFRAVLDSYILGHFSATLAYEKMTAVLVEYLQLGSKQADDHSKRDSLMKALKSLEYIFKFIVKSRILFQQFDGKGQQGFEDGIRKVFKEINRLMKLDESFIIALQATAMKYVPVVIKDVITVFEPKELSLLLQDFVKNIPTEKLTKQKLQCMNDIVHSDIFKMHDCRLILLKMMTIHLKELLSHDEELESCGRLLADILTLLRSNNVGNTKGDIQEVTNVLLRTVIRVVIKLDRNSQLACNFVACLISLLRQMEEFHYENYLNSFPHKVDLMDFLMEIFTMFQDLITNRVYQSDWVTMASLQNATFMRAIKFFTKTLNTDFLDEASFQHQLWNNFFFLAVAFLTQDSLQMENFTQNKRQSMVKKYGDLRCEMGFEIRSMWFNLGAHKIKFIPDMVGPILEMTLIPEQELRRATIPIFFDMMQCELHSTGSFRAFESEMITKLDVLVEGGKGDHEYKVLFHKIMSEWCGKHRILRGAGIEFVNLIEQLLGKLLDYREIIREENRDNRMSCTVNLLNFYKEIHRLEMYVRYLYKLCDLHIACDHYTEAAFTLLQHAKLLNWSDDVLLTRNNRYKDVDTHRELKEALYYDIVDLFQKGKMWEEGIKLCKELAIQHEQETFRYQQLSEILNRQAELYKNITTILRPDPEYFFVGYYGLGFPAFQRNRTFIYRGKEYERLGDFTSRILNLLPNAQKMKTTSPPSDDVTQSHSMHVQIYKVNPMMDEPAQFRGKSVEDNILNFYKVNEVNRFQYSKPFRKGPKNKDNEFASMWIERYVFVTSYQLPGILRWFEIKDTQQSEISPLENGIETMESANSDLRRMILQYHKNPDGPINPLSMKLNGVVDPRVMGGFANYEKAFFVESYIQEHPDDDQKVVQLKDLIAKQVPLLEEGVKLHGQLAPSDLQPFHQNMEKCFVDLKTSAEKKYGKRPAFDVGRPLRKISPQHINKNKARPESILSIQSTHSDGSPVESVPPDVPKKSASRVASAVIRSTSMAIVGDRASGMNRRSKTSEWFANLGGSTNSLDKSGTSVTSQNNNSVELREELTPQRPRRPKSQVGLTGGGKLSQPLPKPCPTPKGPPPLPVKHTGDYGNLPGDEDVPKSEPLAPISTLNKKPPPPLPIKRQDSSPGKPPIMKKNQKKLKWPPNSP